MPNKDKRLFSIVDIVTGDIIDYEKSAEYLSDKYKVSVGRLLMLASEEELFATDMRLFFHQENCGLSNSRLNGKRLQRSCWKRMLQGQEFITDGINWVRKNPN